MKQPLNSKLKNQPVINYELLNESLNYYDYVGFKRIETPWTVSEYVDNLTKPADKISFQLKHNDKCLVASGEQSFLYLYLKDFLPKGQYQTITPCFRYEAFDNLHTKYFMKNELIKTDVVTKNELDKVVLNAFKFFRQNFPKELLTIESVGEGFDIMCNGTQELGSYGIRETDFLKWIYGTGCAEPRTSNLIKQYGLPSKRHREGRGW